MDDAVKSAQGAFEVWSKTPWEERQKVMEKIAEAVGKYEDEMAKLVMLEGGKPVSYPTKGETNLLIRRGLVDVCEDGGRGCSWRFRLLWYVTLKSKDRETNHT